MSTGVNSRGLTNQTERRILNATHVKHVELVNACAHRGTHDYTHADTGWDNGQGMACINYGGLGQRRIDDLLSMTYVSL